MRTFTTIYLALAAIAHARSALAGSFTYNATSFLLNGEPFQLIGGQMDPQRVPWQDWSNRLAMARAMSLNTIFSYIYWNNIEDQPDQYVTNENNNICSINTPECRDQW